MSDEITNYKDLEILLRVNNLLLAKLINEWNCVKKELDIPKKYFGFKFSITQDEFNELCEAYGRKRVENILFKLDRMLLLNKMECPRDIKKYVAKRANKKEVKISNDDGTRQ